VSHAASQVFCRRQGVPGDRLVFEEGDVKHFITLTRSKDWGYVLINSTSKLSTEVGTHDVVRGASNVWHNML
jgi:protease II